MSWTKERDASRKVHGWSKPISGGGRAVLFPIEGSTREDTRPAYELVINGETAAAIRAPTFEGICSEADKIVRRHERKVQTEEGLKA